MQPVILLDKLLGEGLATLGLTLCLKAQSHPRE